MGGLATILRFSSISLGFIIDCAQISQPQIGWEASAQFLWGRLEPRRSKE
jgi:hypothetical protein